MPPVSNALASASGLASSPPLSQDFQSGLHRLESVSLLRAVEHVAQSSLGQHTLMQRAGEAACQWILQALASRNASQPSLPSGTTQPGGLAESGARSGAPSTSAQDRLSLESRNGQPTPALVWCFAGPGNNGGDALCTAAFLRQHGVDARVCLPIAPRGEDAHWAHTQAQDAGVPIHSETPPDDDWQKADWLVDGLFGIGLTREIEAPFSDIVKRLTSRTHHIGRVLALDIPSGLDAETGQVIGDSLAVEASHTLTFIAGKPGLFTGHGRDLVGTIVCARLGIDDAIFERARATLQTASQQAGSAGGSTVGSDAGSEHASNKRADESKHADPDILASRKARLAWQGIELNAPARFMSAFVRRQPSSHKGTFGSVAIIGGDTGTCGAVILAARAALFTGAGRVHAAMIGDGAPPYDPPHPEIMLRHIDAISLDTMDALAIGPGLGQSSRAHDILQQVISLGLPTLIDADALNLIAKHADLAALVRAHGDHIVITPHPGEAARLLGVPTASIESDRVAAALQLAATFNCTALLKGSGTLIATAAGAVAINATGNSGLSTGGSGDVLSGVLGAFLAQHLPPLEAALAGSYIHGQAAEYLSEYTPETGRGQAEGPAGLTAGELAPAMRHRLNALLREFQRI